MWSRNSRRRDGWQQGSSRPDPHGHGASTSGILAVSTFLHDARKRASGGDVTTTEELRTADEIGSQLVRLVRLHRARPGPVPGRAPGRRRPRNLPAARAPGEGRGPPGGSARRGGALRPSTVSRQVSAPRAARARRAGRGPGGRPRHPARRHGRGPAGVRREPAAAQPRDRQPHERLVGRRPARPSCGCSPASPTASRATRRAPGRPGPEAWPPGCTESGSFAHPHRSGTALQRGALPVGLLGLLAASSSFARCYDALISRSASARPTHVAPSTLLPGSSAL